MRHTARAAGTLEVALAHAARLLDTRCARRGRAGGGDPQGDSRPAECAGDFRPGAGPARQGRGGHRGAAARGASQARDAGRMARARRSLHCARDDARPPTRPTRNPSDTRRAIRRLMDAALALCENRIPEAEGALREHLKRHPTDVAAIRMLAEVAARLGRYADAENLLARCLELAPELRGGAAQLRDRAAPAEQAGRGAGRRSSGCSPTSRAIPAIATSRPRFSGASASTTASIELYRRRARRVSAAAPRSG